MGKLLVVTLLLLVGCVDSSQHTATVKINGYNDFPVYMFEYDGCEYISVENTNVGGISHKGNCKYCLERLKNKEAKREN